MKRILLLSILIVTGLCFGGSSLAQTQMTQTQDSSKVWFGTSASLHYIIPSLDIHIGFEDALGENIDLRTTLSGLAFNSGSGAFADNGLIGVGVNGIVNLSDDTSSFNNYIGFGPRAVFLFDGPSDSNILSFALGGFWGTEFFAQNSTRPYIELNASLPITAGGELIPVFLPILSLSTGVNFRF